jgi:3-isopropylmalate/(R)-2-methylmalate dehydratase large subunit
MKTAEYLPNTGRTFYVMENPELNRRQLAGENLDFIPSPEQMRGGISTDEIIPPVFTTSSIKADELGNHLLRGLGGIDQIVTENAIKNARVTTIVARDIGSGSSREHAQLALKQAGIENVFAQTWGNIFGQNNVNYGLPTMRFNSPDVQAFLHSGQPIPKEAYLSSLGSVHRLIAGNDGLLEFTRKRTLGDIEMPQYQTSLRPMNSYEKIISQTLGIEAVEPGQQYLLPYQWAYFYELQSKDMGAAITYLESLGLKVKYPDRVIAFEDHLALKTDHVSEAIRDIQRQMVDRLGIRDFRLLSQGGVPAICHTQMAEDFVLPGQFVVGNDSHTNSLEFMGTMISAIGATEMAVSLFTGDSLVTVPEVIKIKLQGKFARGVHAKDLIMHIGALDQFKRQKIGIGRKLYFEGQSLDEIPADEHFVLGNMSRECGTEGAFIFPNEQTIKYLQNMRPGIELNPQEWEKFRPDPDAKYSHTFNIDLEEVEPTIALPGDPQNAVPLSHLAETTRSGSFGWT